MAFISENDSKKKDKWADACARMPRTKLFAAVKLIRRTFVDKWHLNYIGRERKFRAILFSPE